MGRPRKYDDEIKLSKAIDRYFSSITREKTLCEKADTGEKDEYGHRIYKDEPILNKLGKPVVITEYVTPPTIADLCDFLRIDSATWANYCNPDKHPEFFETTTRARGRIRAWNEKELLTRSGNDIKGIIFNLENNYGYREAKQVDVSSGSLEKYLQQLEEAGEGQEF